MSEAVILKSSHYGIQLNLNPELPFPELKERIYDKFVESEKFFRNGSFAISFEGRDLSEEEENEIVTMINEKTTAHVICIVAEDDIREEILRKKTESEALSALEKEEVVEEESAPVFHPNEAEILHRNVTDGEMLIMEQSLVIFGNVEPGATVTSRGSITVLGNLSGKVWAGSDGDEEAFIFALNMEPENLRIGPLVIPPQPGEVHLFRRAKKKAVPRIARVQDGMVKISLYEK